MDGSKKVESKKAPAAGEGCWVSGKFLKGAFALKVRGDSMVAPAGQWPTFPPGCIIIVDPNLEAESGYLVLVEFKDGLTSFQKLEIYDGSGQKWLKSLNPAYVPSRLPDDARIVGVVVQVEIHTKVGERQAAREAAQGVAHV
jgi:SOS-response transcriptional repressor LexA